MLRDSDVIVQKELWLNIRKTHVIFCSFIVLTTVTHCSLRVCHSRKAQVPLITLAQQSSELCPKSVFTLKDMVHPHKCFHLLWLITPLLSTVRVCLHWAWLTSLLGPIYTFNMWSASEHTTTLHRPLHLHLVLITVISILLALWWDFKMQFSWVRLVDKHSACPRSREAMAHTDNNHF